MSESDFAVFSAEGSLSASSKATYGQIKKFSKNPLATFMRMVVVDVISDPTQIDDNKIEYWKNVIQVRNYGLGRLLPRNSIIAQKVRSGRTPFDDPMILFPFFPSHLALPSKPGEMIWAMFEDPNAYENNLGFWFCRISEPHLIDDVNHTHAPGKADQTNVETLIEKLFGSFTPHYDMHNGPVVRSSDGRRGVPQGGQIISLPNRYEGDDVFEKLITESDAAKLMQYEPVPRFRKRPGDIALEGTNNALIVLGTDRVGPHANYQTITNYEEFGPVPVYPESVSGSAGSIDMVVGRGMFSTTGGNVVSTTELSSPEDNPRELKKEIAKFPKKLVVPNEGDPDFANDRSRLLLSQRTSVDSNFGTAEYNAQFQIADAADGDAAITIKTDKVRIIARSDISLIVTNFTYNPTSIDNTTPGFKTDSPDQQKWASITIKTNGDIVFTPSQEGYIKLGGDTADKAVVCTDIPFTPSPPGQVSAVPIFTTGNSQIATSKPGQGTYAKKVLVIG